MYPEDEALGDWPSVPMEQDHNQFEFELCDCPGVCDRVNPEQVGRCRDRLGLLHSSANVKCPGVVDPNQTGTVCPWPVPPVVREVCPCPPGSCADWPDRVCKLTQAAPPKTPVENPKQAVGDTKVPLHLWPATATALGAMAMLDGAEKYGRNNTRAVGKIVASTYVRATLSHLHRWMEGERAAPDSGVHHLGHALACLAILVDAEYAGNLDDDRNYPGGFDKLMAELEPLVKEIKARHAGKNPKHFSIKDKP